MKISVHVTCGHGLLGVSAPLMTVQHVMYQCFFSQVLF